MPERPETDPALNTIAAPVTAETTVRHSRFVAHAAPVGSQADTLAFYERVADPSATHNCWAWKLDGSYRFNDDGEPGGTAGRPILAAIEGKDLANVMVVVTRYFGGIKLGVGGLVRAYSGAASRCLDQAEIVTVHPLHRIVIEAGFDHTGAVHAALESCAAAKLDEQFTADGFRLTIDVPADRLRQLERTLRDATRGAARLRRA